MILLDTNVLIYAFDPDSPFFHIYFPSVYRCAVASSRETQIFHATPLRRHVMLL